MMNTWDDTLQATPEGRIFHEASESTICGPSAMRGHEEYGVESVSADIIFTTLPNAQAVQRILEEFELPQWGWHA